MRPHHASVAIVASLLLAFPVLLSAQAETALTARKRVFPDAGPGLRAIKRDSAGRYYVLTSRDAAVLVYDVEGKRIGQIPATPSPEASLVFGDDLDVDASGRLYVADRGGNAIKVFGADGKLAQTIPVVAPTSVVTLGGGETVVASLKSPKLVSVLDERGKLLREFGEPAEAADRQELNRFLNIGRLATDRESHIYYSFSYLPEPTVRKYDRYGYAMLEIEATTLEFQPAAQAARREIARQEPGGTPSLNPLVSAIGVDAQTQELWMAAGGLLLHFGADGVRRGLYRIFTPEGARIEAAAILVEPGRLLIASDPLGIFEFPRPDKALR